MATTATAQVLMPEMGESVTEGTVLEWHVAEGEAVEEGQTVVEVSTDKVDAEVPAPADGTLTKILVQPDETIEVGKPLAEIDTTGEAPEGHKEAAQATAEDVADGDGRAPAAEAETEAEERTAARSAPAAEAKAEPPAEGKAVEILMPEMGESVTEGTVLE